MNPRLRIVLAFLTLCTAPVSAFTHNRGPLCKQSVLTTQATTMSSEDNPSSPTPAHHPFCDLPGDPSLMLNTNVDLGAKKMDVMKGISKSIAKHTGKPESYVAVSVTDNAAVIFGGTDEPCAIGILGSIGGIAKESNGAITSDVTDLLEEFGVKESRLYINFFDMDRANVGWSRRTFAG